MAELKKQRSDNGKSYQPSNPDHWQGDLPASIEEALDRVAAALSSQGISPIPVKKK